MKSSHNPISQDFDVVLLVAFLVHSHIKSHTFISQIMTIIYIHFKAFFEIPSMIYTLKSVH